MTLLGIDGGGSGVRALLTRDGVNIGRGGSGPANPLSVGFETAAANVKRAAEEACRAAGGLRAVDAACVGLAGVGRLSAAEKMRGALRGVGFPPRTLLTHDARIALAGAAGRDSGVALIAGTGSICYGRSESGVEARCGGWGSLLDDAGGGYAVGLAGLRAAMRAYDGRLESRALLESALQFCGVDSAEEIVAWEGLVEKSVVAAFAPRVFSAAEAGCPEAARIVQEGAGELAAMAAVVADRLGFGASARVWAAGGLAKAYPSYVSAMGAASSLRFSPAQNDGAAGAVFLAERIVRL